MISFAEFPLKHTSFITARETAIEESMDHPDHFIYVLKNNSGVYLIDYLGLKHDDEHIIATYQNGEKKL